MSFFINAAAATPEQLEANPGLKIFAEKADALAKEVGMNEAAAASLYCSLMELFNVLFGSIQSHPNATKETLDAIEDGCSTFAGHMLSQFSTLILELKGTNLNAMEDADERARIGSEMNIKIMNIAEAYSALIEETQNSPVDVVKH